MKKLDDFIEGDLSEYDIDYRVHATRRMFQRSIHQEDVELILKYGQVIEQYDDDFPLPSLLLSGENSNGKPLHIVVAMNFSERKLVIVTAYKPNSIRWMNNFSRRL